MITEDYVSFGTAKLMKEKEFNADVNCTHVYVYGRVVSKDYFRDINELEEYIQAPTLQMAMKWLREVHGLHISLEPCYDYDSMHVIFLAFVQNVADVHEFMDGRKNVASYPNAEKSCELAIRYCLENLI